MLYCFNIDSIVYTMVYTNIRASPVAQLVKNLPTMQKTWI